MQIQTLLLVLLMATLSHCQELVYEYYMENIVPNLFVARKYTDKVPVNEDSTIYQMRDKKDTSTYITVKVFENDEYGKMEYNNELKFYKTLGAEVPLKTRIFGLAWEAGISGTFGWGDCRENVKYFIAIHFLNKTLDKHCTRDSMPVSDKEWIDIGLQMLKSIEFMHSKNVTHGNVTPSCFMVGNHASSCNINFKKVFITDFSRASSKNTPRQFDNINATNPTFMSIVEQEFILTARHPAETYPALTTNSEFESCIYSFLSLKLTLGWKSTCDEMTQKLESETDETKAAEDYLLLTQNVIKAKKAFAKGAKEKLDSEGVLPNLSVLIKETLGFATDTGSCYTTINQIIVAWESLHKEFNPVNRPNLATGTVNKTQTNADRQDKSSKEKVKLDFFQNLKRFTNFLTKRANDPLQQPLLRNK